MPGKKKGPGKWIENRADRILDKDLKSRYGGEAKSVAFAIATQQAHKLGKTPKKGKGPGGMYGTKEGKREAKAKYDKPKKEYRKTALDRFHEKIAKDRCWKGYEPVPGKKPYSDGSCRPVGGKKKSALDRLREKMASVEYRGETFPGYNKPKNAPAGSEKKKVVLAKKGDKVKKVSFGQRGYKHNYSEEAKKSYLARSAGIKGKDDKFSANYWSRKHLWPKGEKADGTAKDQEKKAAVGNLTGRDNRSPFIGGTQFPTESAKQPAQQKLDESIDVAEAGPAPLTPKARTNYSKTMDQATKIPGGWTLPSPQEKTAMDAITKYLTKTAAGRQELIKHAKALETNEKDLKRMDTPKPMKTGPAHPADDAVARGKRDTDDKLKELFSHYPTEKAVIS